MGKMIFGLGLRTKKITRRASQDRLKKALVFSSERLGYLFRIHNLGVSPEFYVTNVTKTDKCNGELCLDVVTSNHSGEVSESLCNQLNPSEHNTYKNGNIGNIENREIGAKGNVTNLEREVFEI